jgi:hypothetical protein
MPRKTNPHPWLLRPHYHTKETWTWPPPWGSELLIAECQEFFKGNRTIPVLKTANQLKPDGFVTCTMTTDLMISLVRQDAKTIKSLDVALKYGFRGMSRGKQNGIFFQRETDSKMTAETLQLVRKHWDEVGMDLLIGQSFESRPEGLKFVKVVHHDPSGRRVVGAMYRTRIIFVGVASY